MSSPNIISLALAACMIVTVLGAALYAARANRRRKRVYKIGDGHYYDRATVAARHIDRIPGENGRPYSYRYMVCFRTQIGLIDLSVPRQLFDDFSVDDTGLLQIHRERFVSFGDLAPEWRDFA